LATGGQDSVALLWKSNMETTKKQFYEDYTENIEYDHNNLLTSQGSKSGSQIMSNRNNSVEIDYKKNKLIWSLSASQDSYTEELCKFFDKMVYQLEIITK
jgi:hypothetical protein